jgi:predicted secreted hydrolase
LRASINKNDEFVARFTAQKPIAINGHADTPTISSKYFSYTRLDINGRLGKNGNSEEFSGSAWMDGSMIVYWEGAYGVRGQRKGQHVSGDAYAELVGYDKRRMPGMRQFFKNYLRR